MARCGRCGLWKKIPPDEREQQYAGTCLWYQIRLEPEFEYDQRDCKDFFERIPDYDASWHFDYKIKRDNLGDAYTAASNSEKKAKMALVFSIIGLLFSFLRILF